MALDAEHVLYTAKDQGLLCAATQSCNADLWKRWQHNVERLHGTLVLLHVRSHALDGRPDSELRGQQILTRRRYAVPARRVCRQLADEEAMVRWRELHWPELLMQGNVFADSEASQAKKNAVPLGTFQKEAERWQAYAWLVARRLATVEAHIRDARNGNQRELKEVQAVSDLAPYGQR